MQTLLDHVDFQRKFTHFMSELWIDPEVCLILSVGEPSDFLADEALVDDSQQKIIALPGFHLVRLFVDTVCSCIERMSFDQM